MNTKNLLKFAEFLEDYDGEFGLGVHDLMSSLLEKCGFKRKDWEDWHGFYGRIFDLNYWSEEWDWCFHHPWMKTDPTAIGCAARIRILIEEGLPENCYEQMKGEEALSYNPEDLKLIKEIEKILE